MSFEAKTTGDRCDITAQERENHAIVHVVQRYGREPLKAVSVFVNTKPDADIAVFINGKIWKPEN